MKENTKDIIYLTFITSIVVLLPIVIGICEVYHNKTTPRCNYTTRIIFCDDRPNKILKVNNMCDCILGISNDQRSLSTFRGHLNVCEINIISKDTIR
jgi:hypothetical protein